jgi:hypothetical protein
MFIMLMNLDVMCHLQKLIEIITKYLCLTDDYHKLST